MQSHSCNSIALMIVEQERSAPADRKESGTGCQKILFGYSDISQSNFITMINSSENFLSFALNYHLKSHRRLGWEIIFN